ncbi:MAG TPA: 3-dehydroquinate synthase, partial [Burkholderiaceae bacterium]|nr:3-dehydroquinate synthase [Burkholderiaceae bacterium]
GHTFGHAIEAMTSYSDWLHGEAVGCGLVLAAELSCLLGALSASDVQAVESAVSRAGLPTRVEGLSALKAIEMMRGDKKTEAGQIRFIVLDQIGRAMQRTVPHALLLQALNSRGFV